jgi:hypothetical protein
MTRRNLVGGGLALALALWGCEQSGGPTGGGAQSVRVQITAPTNLGSSTAPLQSHTVTVDLDILGAGGQVLAMDKELAVYAWTLGTLGRDYGEAPDHRCEDAIARVSVTGGRARGVTLTLSEAFGPVTLWVEDCEAPSPTWAVGATPVLWFAYPTIADVQNPPQRALDQLQLFWQSALENKQVVIDASPSGKMVVTSTFAQFYTVTDTGLSDFASLEVYSFSRPPVRVGDVLAPRSLTGAISEFNGMTELNFPLQQVVERNQPLPPPTVLTVDDMAYGGDLNKATRLESLEASIVEFDDGCVCPPGADYTKFQQWQLGFRMTPGGAYNCGTRYAIPIVTAGQVIGWDPPQPGRHVTMVRGVLVNVAGGADRNGNPFSFFILHPRDSDDLVAAQDSCTTM